MKGFPVEVCPSRAPRRPVPLYPRCLQAGGRAARSGGRPSGWTIPEPPPVEHSASSTLWPRALARGSDAPDTPRRTSRALCQGAPSRVAEGVCLRLSAGLPTSRDLLGWRNSPAREDARRRGGEGAGIGVATTRTRPTCVYWSCSLTTSFRRLPRPALPAFPCSRREAAAVCPRAPSDVSSTDPMPRSTFRSTAASTDTPAPSPWRARRCASTSAKRAS